MRKNNSLIFSDMAYKRLIGILGMALPLICFAGGILFAGYPLQRSISYYFYTNVRDFFIGLMFGLSFFLITHKGYELIDLITNMTIGIMGLGLALFPCLDEGSNDRIGFFQLRPEISNTVHIICAGIFFFLLALTSLFLFTKTDKNKAPTNKKRLRNLIYILCGCIMLASLASVAILMIALDDQALAESRMVFFLETLMLEAFGISWLVKGKTIFRD